MKIVSIFDGKLYSFQYRGQRQQELSRLLRQWADPSYMYQFLKNNKNDLPANKTIRELAQIIELNTWGIIERLKELSYSNTETFESFFAPLNNFQYQYRQLAEQKGRENYIRIYALKIDDNCFIITGGAIKFTQFMEDRVHTDEELDKITRCRDYLVNANVFDAISFNDFLKELK